MNQYNELARAIEQSTRRSNLREFIAADWQPNVESTNRGMLIEVPMVHGFTCVIDVLFRRSKTHLRNAVRGQKIVWRVYASVKDAVQDIATAAINALRIACEFVKDQIMRRRRLRGYRNSRQERRRKFERRSFCYVH